MAQLAREKRLKKFEESSVETPTGAMDVVPQHLKINYIDLSSYMCVYNIQSLLLKTEHS